MGEGREYSPEEIAEFEKTRIPESQMEKAEEMARTANPLIDKADDNRRQAALLRELGLNERASAFESGAERVRAQVEKQMEFAGDVYDYDHMSEDELRSIEKNIAVKMKQLQDDIKLLQSVEKGLTTDEQKVRCGEKIGKLGNEYDGLRSRAERIVELILKKK